MTDHQVGDRVSLRYIDHIEAGKPIEECPLVEGRIVSVPMGDSPYYELIVDDAEIRKAGGWVSEEAEGLPYLAAEKEIIGGLPVTWRRKDVEAWLEQSS